MKNCREISSVSPFKKRVKICQEKRVKKCDSPCFNCPLFCRPNKQYWCEDNYKVWLHECIAHLLQQEPKKPTPQIVKSP